MDAADTLPEGAHRYLAHAMPPGVPVPTRATITFTGELRLRPTGRWMRFSARETIELRRGFTFAARAWLGPVPVTTRDRFADGRAEGRVRLLGLVPVVTRRGPDADRAMRSRLVVESVWLPSTFRPEAGARWAEADGDGLSVVVRDVYGEDVSAHVRVGPAGELLGMSLRRWADLGDGGTYTAVPFETRVEAESTYGPYTIPSRLRATWWSGTPKQFEFFRASVRQAELGGNA